MASYYNYFEIKTEGTKNTINSICNAIRDYAPECDITCKKNKIVVSEMYKISDTDDACEFAAILARAADGANFHAEGFLECSVAGDRMNFEIKLNDNKLTLRNSDWYYERSNFEIEDCESYEEYLEEYGDDLTEEEFNVLFENEWAYEYNGGIHLDVSFVTEHSLEF